MTAATALAMAMVVVTPMTAVADDTDPFEPAVGAPVVLDGNDPMDHVTAITQYIQDVYTNLDTNQDADYQHNGEIAVVGFCADAVDSSGSGSGLTGMFDGETPARTFVGHEDAASIAGLFSDIASNNYQHIHICSDFDDTLSAAQQDELANWGSAIARHVNRGGGLFATGHKYAWLNDVFPSLTVNDTGSSQSFVTADGAAFFDNLNLNDPINAVNHYTFADVGTTSLQTLLTEQENGAGGAVAIGGTSVAYPQISLDGISEAGQGLWTEYVLRAAKPDGTPLGGVMFDYKLDVTDGTEQASLRHPDGVKETTTGQSLTGSGEIEAGGEYPLEIFYDGIGQTRLSVTLSYVDDQGSTVSAGGAMNTTWDVVPLPDAPTVANAYRSGDTVAVSWSEPDGPDGAEPYEYVVEYREQGTFSWTVVSENPQTTTVDIDGLDTELAYEFRVAAMNSRGQGAWSMITAEQPRPSPSSPSPSEPEPTRDADGKLPRPPTGGSWSWIGGVENPLTVRVNIFGGTALIIDRFEEIMIELGRQDGDVAPTSTGVGDAMRLAQGDNVSVSVDGFRPFSTVRLWLFSEPQLLGEFRTDAQGALDLGLAEISEEVSPCTHTLQVEGRLADGREIAAALGVWVVADPFPFGDVDPDGFHAPGIGCLEHLDIAHGVSDGVYDEEATVSRGQAASLTARALGEDLSGTSSFADANASVHDGAIAALEALGIVAGRADGSFDAAGDVSRGHAATILAEAAGLDTSGTTSFADAAGNVHSGAIAALVEAGIIDGYGDGTFRPGEAVSRAQFASMLALTLPHLGVDLDGDAA